MNTSVERIDKLRKELNAVILAHNYCLPEVQDIADKVGDSLGLSIEASKTDADVIVFCGVTFMAETAKILSPSKKVLIPEPAAICPMAQMCTAEQIVQARKVDPDAEVVGYVNSTAAAKAEMDVCCTSSNAIKIVSQCSKKVLFVPDKNLGAYAASKNPEKDVTLWHGFCPIHQSISVDQVREMRGAHPDAPIMAHPECRSEVLDLADFIGSTEAMIGFCKDSGSKEFVVLTECGMKHRLEKALPGYVFHFPENAICGAMKMTTVDNILRCMEDLSGEVMLPEDVIGRARKAVDRMINCT